MTTLDLEQMLAKIKSRQWMLADIDWDAPGAELVTEEQKPKLKVFMADLMWIEHLGALLFRRGLGEALGRWFGADLPLADVRRILDMIAHDNATRLYGPTAGAGVAP